MSLLSGPTGVAALYAIRPMRESDIDRVVAIERLGASNPWPRDAFEHEVGSNPHSWPIVASARGAATEPAGFCVFWVVLEELSIQNLAVAPEHRRRGLGGLLLWQTLETGKERGATSAHLEVRRSNVAARRLYESFGFEPAGERRDYYSRPREDALLYRKLLDQPRDP